MISGVQHFPSWMAERHDKELHNEERYRLSIKKADSCLTRRSIAIGYNNKPQHAMMENGRNANKRHGSALMELPERLVAYPPSHPRGSPHKSQRLMYFADAKDKALAFFVILFALSGAGHPLVWFYFMGKLNTAISAAYNLTTCEERRKLDGEFMFNVIKSDKNIWYIYSLLCVIAWVFFSCLFLDICIRMTTFRQLKRLKLVLFAKLLSLDAGWYDKNDVGHLMEQMTITMSQVEISVGSIIGESLFKVFVAFIGFIGTMPQGWRLSLLMNGIMIPANLFRVMVSASLRDRLMLQQSKLYGDAATVSEETLSGISVVWAFNGQNQQIRQYNQKLDQVKRANNAAGIKIGLTRGFAELIVLGGQSLAMWYMIEVSIDYPDDYGLDQFFSIFVSSLSCTYLMSMGMSGLEQVTRSRSAIKSLVGIIETPSLIDPLDTNGDRIDSVIGEIEFRNVQFSYPTRKEVQVLPDLSLTISSGKTYALVGESGNGKSTIVQLILRLYDPDEGEVCLDGTNLKDLNVEWYRSQIGVVSQMPTLFAGTVKENITGGDPNAVEEDVLNAAKMANIHDFVIGLPDQYETPVGQGGAGFSGGQKQRLAIARALYKKPKILILDEATSALDNESEKVVQKSLNKATIGRTTLVIAHRLSTVRDADVIVVMEKGRILEKGSHDQLMSLNGMYYALVKGQQSSGLQEVPSVDDITRDSVDLHLTQRRSRSLRGVSSSGGVGLLDAPNQGRRSTQKDKLTFVQELKKLSSQSMMVNPAEIGDEDKETTTKKKHRPKNLIMQMMKFIRKDGLLFFVTMFFVLLRSFEQPLNCFFLLSLITPLEEPDNNERQALALKWIVCQAGLALVMMFSFFLSFYLLIRGGQELGCHLRQKAFASIIHRSQSWHDDSANSTAHVTSALQQAGELAPAVIYDFFVFYFESVSVSACAFVVACVTTWKVSLPFLVLIPIILIPYFISSAVNRPKKGAISWDVEAEVYAVETLQNIRAVTVLGLEKRRYAIYAEMMESWFRERRSKIGVNALCFALDFGFFGKASSLAILIWGVYLMQKCVGIHLADVYTASIAMLVAGDYIIDQACKLPNWGDVERFARTMLDYVNKDPNNNGEEKVDTTGMKTINDDDFLGEIQFDHVAFRYPGRKNIRILEDFDIGVKQGEMLALVGTSGGGKSTILKMMERFYDPLRGQIRLDGSNLREFDIQWLRSHIGFVAQDPILFSGTIAQNIAFGEGGEAFSSQEIIAAASEANCHNFVTTLPFAYDTPVGHKGQSLSGGQRQRVCIARALLRKPKILLLDEATSALDNASEKIVQEALDAVIKGRTVITIAHRLSTIQNANKIAVVGQGRILEMGTHKALMEKKGIYYGLQKATENLPETTNTTSTS